MSTRSLWSLLLVLAAAPSALANDYVSENPDDWFRFQNTTTGAEVESRMAYDLGGWRLWTNFAGLGDTWIYTADNHDYAWLWNGQTYTLLGNLDGAVGSARTIDMAPCNQGSAVVASRGPLQTPAGDFAEVTELQLQTSCADAGVSRIWFAKGVGVVGWAEQSIMGEQVYELTAAFVDGRHLTGPAAPTPTPTASRPVAPAEHAPMEGILWGANDTYLVLDTYRDALTGLAGSGVGSEIAVASNYVASQVRYELTQAGAPLDDAEFLVVDLDSVWMRDYGPVILLDANGTRVVADLDYYYNRPTDDDFPAAYANYRGWRRVHVDLSYEGGNFATDGQGLGMSSMGVQWFNDDLSRSEIEDRFEQLGCDRVEYFEPLVDEGTTHIDMFARVMTDTAALVSRYPSGHKQAAVTNAAASKMRALGYQVTRVDADTGHDEYATYTNSLLANGIALVPQYRSSSKNRAALDAYRALGYRAVGIDSRLVIQYGGATHCLSMQVPAGN